MSERTQAAFAAGDEASASAEELHAGARSVVGEFIDAARTAVISILDEQKDQAADRTAAVAEAVRCAERSLDAAALPTLARHAAQTAGQIDAFTTIIRERSWDELAADTAAFARRQPVVFIAAAMALGALAGRLLSAPPARQVCDPEPLVKAAVASAPAPAAATGHLAEGGAPGVP